MHVSNQKIHRPDHGYTFGDRGEYEIEVAATIEQRCCAWSLAYRHYLRKGYAEPNSDGLWYGLHDALPETTTFLVTHDGEDVAALTMVFDSCIGLPADKLYAPELNRLRRQGCRLFEIVSLVSEVTDRRGCMEVLKHMFKLAHLTAWRIEKATNWIITVNPRHTAYYQRAMLFERIGEKRTYGKVNGAPAVLLSLNAETARMRYREKYGTEEGSIYRHFFDLRVEKQVVRFLEQSRGPLNCADIRMYFEEKRPLLSGALPKVRQYVWSRYERPETCDPQESICCESKPQSSAVECSVAQ